MRVEKFEGKKEVIKTEYTERDLKAELNFYLSDKFIQDLFLLDEKRPISIPVRIPIGQI